MRHTNAVSIIRLRSDSPIFSALVDAHQAEWGYLMPTASKERIQSRLARLCDSGEPRIVVVATDGDELMGAAMLTDLDDLAPNSGRTPWLTGLYVAPPYRGEGLARALVDHIESLAAERWFSAIHLDCLAELVPFYEKLGYAMVEFRQYKSYPLALMLKNLPWEACKKPHGSQVLRE